MLIQTNYKSSACFIRLTCAAAHLTENLCIPLLIKTKAVPFSAILIRWAPCSSLKCGSASRLRHPSFTDPVYGGDGVRRRHGLARENASAIVGIFAGSMYLAALPGGWLADNWLGQQRAVWYGSILIARGTCRSLCQHGWATICSLSV